MLLFHYTPHFTLWKATLNFNHNFAVDQLRLRIFGVELGSKVGIPVATFGVL